MDLTDLFTYAWAAVGLVMTVSWLRRRHSPAGSCACRHMDNAHDEGGWCRQEVTRPKYGPHGGRFGKEYVRCGCRNPALGAALWGGLLSGTGQGGTYTVLITPAEAARLDSNAAEGRVTPADLVRDRVFGP
jgi:hypothetical protein